VGILVDEILMDGNPDSWEPLSVTNLNAHVHEVKILHKRECRRIFLGLFLTCIDASRPKCEPLLVFKL
jgi:phage-related protein